MIAPLARPPRRLMVLAIGLVIAFALTSTPAFAHSRAPTNSAASFWGAIAISVDGSYGRAWNYPTKAGALKGARAECREHAAVKRTCKSVVYTVNGCAAVSARFNSKGRVRQYATAFGVARAPVIRAAHRKCVKNYGKKCQKLASVCTDSQ